MIDMREMVSPGERILWTGKPDKKVTVLEAIFNPLLIVAAVWLIFDLGVMRLSFSDGTATMLIPFMILHLMPVWIYLAGVITASLRQRNTFYMITTAGLYIGGGVVSFRYEMKPWVDIGHISIHQGVFDRMMGVGDVVFVCGHTSHDARTTRSEGNLAIKNISDFQNIFRLAGKVQRDIYSDTMYPNAMRPESNPGYNTRYDGRG